MKTSVFLINTSRGPLVAEESLINALEGRRIAGAGLGLFDIEPLSLNYPLCHLDKTVLTPHLGYVVAENYTEVFE